MAGLTLDQFWLSTPYELGLVLGGFRQRFDMQMEMLAWHASRLMACWVKKPPTPKQLLGRDNSISILDFNSPEEFYAFEAAELAAAEEAGGSG